ncbi:MAG: MbtH family protein [Actinophytocola sp.]|uniref:MbtH family protein n=1 Tax=Actinophytocola sp. TaxID=1872138 RepID=UPI003C7780F4
MSNPFDDETSSFHVLVNDERQYSLWPSGIPVPEGWAVVLHDRPHTECLAHVESVWTDLRPRGLVEAMAAADEERR